MMTTTLALVLSAALTFAMIMLPAVMRLRLWTVAGFKQAAGNREQLPEPPAWVARAERASRNMLENMVIFVAVIVAAHAAGAPSELAMTGATVFFWARLVYWFLYLAGIPYLRTAVWSVGVVGCVLVGVAALGG